MEMAEILSYDNSITSIRYSLVQHEQIYNHIAVSSTALSSCTNLLYIQKTYGLDILGKNSSSKTTAEQLWKRIKAFLLQTCWTDNGFYQTTKF